MSEQFKDGIIGIGKRMLTKIDGSKIEVEVQRRSHLGPQSIGSNDRAVVTTDSGSEYILRRSPNYPINNDGQHPLRIYKISADGTQKWSKFVIAYPGDDLEKMFEVGVAAEFSTAQSLQKGSSTVNQSTTKVIDIHLYIGIDNLIENGQIEGVNLLDELRASATGQSNLE